MTSARAVRLAALCLGAALLVPLPGTAAAGEVVQGDAAPDFTLRRSDGQPVRLADLRGEVVVVVFWATWCPYCKQLLPGIQKLKDFYAGAPLRILAVDVWERADPEAFMRDTGLNLEVLVSGDRIAEDWGVHHTPTVFVIHTTGQVIYRTSSYDPDDPDLAGVIDAALRQAELQRRR